MLIRSLDSVKPIYQTPVASRSLRARNIDLLPESPCPLLPGLVIFVGVIFSGTLVNAHLITLTIFVFAALHNTDVPASLFSLRRNLGLLR